MKVAMVAAEVMVVFKEVKEDGAFEAAPGGPLLAVHLQQRGGHCTMFLLVLPLLYCSDQC